MDRMISESYSGNRGICSEISEVSVVVTLMEGVMVVNVSKISAKALISGLRSFGGW